MKIRLDKTEEIDRTLSIIQGNARERLLDTVDLQTAVADAERKLTTLGIPKKYWADCMITLIPEKVPNSYRFAAMGTAATMIRGSAAWYITQIRRTRCGNQAYGGGREDLLTLSGAAKNAIPNSYRI